MTSAVLAVDVGSSAIRAAVVDESGNVRAERRVERQDAESGLTFDAEVLWHQVVATAAAVTGGHGHDIRGIGIAGHIGTVLTDRSLAPVGPAHGWADSAGLAELRERLGERAAAVLRASGRPTVTGGALAALVHLRTTDPPVFARVAYALQPKDFLVARLTGVVATDHTSAAYFGASAVRERDWSAATIAAAGLDPGLFPAQHPSTGVVGSTSPAVTRLLGLARDVPVVGGGPDGTVGATLVAGTRTDAVADVAGTTDVLVRVLDHPADPPPGATLNPYTSPGLWTVGGATGMTGGAVSWWAQLLGYAGPAAALERLGTEMDRIGPGAGGVLADPNLSGSRFPRWSPATRGSVSGLRADHGPAHVLLAVLESVAYAVREGVDRLAADPGLSIVLAGGTARSPRLARLRADVLGRPVTVCTEPDVSLKGAALLALTGTGGPPLDEQARLLRGPLHTYDPEPARAARYEHLYRDWRAATGGEA
ncbi:xylulokinase [Asanoa iriomotensis]|uniref:Sugar kinase n=1 Tax=Asanoa iriomotensis TaxID=234613 RepID=A0ABQ4BZ16_9ACTN|nr:FGGY-family carbohydrate kinase [Asanoa iriomotensis]GIF55740.1 sugar kinase [Asanoa iriomotensis]